MDGEEINVAGGPTKHNNAETRAENGGPLVRSAETVHSSGPKVSSVPIAIEPAAKSPDAPRPSSCPPGPPCSSPMVHDRRSNSTNDLKRDRSASQTSQTQTDQIPVLELDDLKVPIVGYEIMEQRAKFTVFKLLVNRGPNDNWFVFRRYTDFVRINEQLKVLFPTFRLALPPKKWFGNNFDTSFLEDRQLGLQAFINNITGHKDIVKSKYVREFFCLDEPPGPHDSLEESRALCESLEDAVYHLRHEVAKKDKLIGRLTEEVVALREENEQLLKSLRSENSSSSFRQSSPPPESESSLAECEYPSAVEADQSHTNEDSDKSSVTTPDMPETHWKSKLSTTDNTVKGADQVSPPEISTQ